MTTPLEAGAKAVGDLDWSDTRYPPDYDEITRAVFGSIDREGLVTTIWRTRLGTTKRQAEPLADAILAWLNGSGK